MDRFKHCKVFDVKPDPHTDCLFMLESFAMLIEAKGSPVRLAETLQNKKAP